MRILTKEGKGSRSMSQRDEDNCILKSLATKADVQIWYQSIEK